MGKASFECNGGSDCLPILWWYDKTQSPYNVLRKLPKGRGLLAGKLKEFLCDRCKIGIGENETRVVEIPTPSLTHYFHVCPQKLCNECMAICREQNVVARLPFRGNTSPFRLEVEEKIYPRWFLRVATEYKGLPAFLVAVASIVLATIGLCT